MYEVKVEKVGESLGIVLPREILEEFNLKEGDRLSVTKTSDGVAVGETEFEENFKPIPHSPFPIPKI